jgi:hypothetical protein
VEVPVDCTARHAGRSGDFPERGPRDAAIAKHALGRVEQLLAGNGGFGLRSAGHAARSGGLQTVVIVCILAVPGKLHRNIFLFFLSLL